MKNLKYGVDMRLDGLMSGRVYHVTSLPTPYKFLKVYRAKDGKQVNPKPEKIVLAMARTLKHLKKTSSGYSYYSPYSDFYKGVNHDETILAVARSLLKNPGDRVAVYNADRTLSYIIKYQPRMKTQAATSVIGIRHPRNKVVKGIWYMQISQPENTERIMLKLAPGSLTIKARTAWDYKKGKTQKIDITDLKSMQSGGYGIGTNPLVRLYAGMSRLSQEDIEAYLAESCLEFTSHSQSVELLKEKKLVVKI